MADANETTLKDNRLDEMKDLLDGLNNRSAVVLFLINEDLQNDYKKLLMLRSEAGELRTALRAVSHCFGRLYKEYVSTLEDGEKSDRVPSQG